MYYGTVPFENRLKDNIRRYHSKDLYDVEAVQWQMQQIAKDCGLEMLLTDRHGEEAVVLGNFEGFHPDVVKEPGIRVRIYNHTTGHLYLKGEVSSEKSRQAVAMLVRQLEDWGTKAYLANELMEYKEELENLLEEKQRQLKGNDHKDVLTGTLGKAYFENRMKIIDRAQVAPVALIQANINDWQFFHDHYGIEESDRLISEVGKMILQNAKPDYVIGRCGGDLFNIIIPMPEDDEAEEYVANVRKAIDGYDDPILVPSVAFGTVYKENVEESLFDKLSDAEYEMFNDKLKIKNAPGYREKLEKGLKNK